MSTAKGKNKKRKNKEVDWTSPELFDKNRSVIYIEHSTECPIFQIKAEEFLIFLQNNFPEREFVLIRNNYDSLQPRPGAFEIEFSQNALTSKYNLWSGIDKGPPRRDKFPNFNNLLPEVQKVLKKFYANTRFEYAEDDDDEANKDPHTGAAAAAAAAASAADKHD